MMNRKVLNPIQRIPWPKIDGTGSRLKRYVPKAKEISHPFYYPTDSDRMIMVMTESEPTLLNMGFKLPLYNSHLGPPANQYRLQEVMLPSTGQARIFLESWPSPKQVNYSRISPQVPESHELSERLELMMRNEPAIQELHQLESLLHKHCYPVGDFFPEDIFIFLLSRNSLDLNQFIILMEYLLKAITQVVDQVQVANKVLHYVLDTKLAYTSTQTTMLTQELVTTLQQRFSSPTSKWEIFDDGLLQKLLRFYILKGDLQISDTILEHTILKRHKLVDDEYIIQYLTLIERRSIRLENDHDVVLFKWRYIKNLKPFILYSHIPELYKFIVPLCSNYKELEKLLELVNKNHATDSVMASLIEDSINRISNFGTFSAFRSSFLVNLYRFLEMNIYKDTNVPTFILDLFLSRFIELGNFTMISKLFKDGVPHSIDPHRIILAIRLYHKKKIALEAKEVDKQNIGIWTSKTLRRLNLDLDYLSELTHLSNEAELELFITKYIFPSILILDIDERRFLLEHINQPENFMVIFWNEITLFKQDKPNILEDLLDNELFLFCFRDIKGIADQIHLIVKDHDKLENLLIDRGFT